MEGRINLTLVINETDIQLNPEIELMSKAMDFAKNMGKNLSSTYGQKPLDTTTDALKTASKIQRERGLSK